MKCSIEIREYANIRIQQEKVKQYFSIIGGV